VLVLSTRAVLSWGGEGEDAVVAEGGFVLDLVDFEVIWWRIGGGTRLT
jgi:hypothetical protein